MENIVIEVSLEEKLLDQLKSLASNPILENAKNIHLVSIINDSMKSMLPLNLESEKQQRNYLEELHQKLQASFGLKDNSKFQSHFHYSNDEKIIALKFLEQNQSDLVVTATRGNNGIKGVFQNSFTEFLIENSPCDVYVVRPVH